MAGPSRRIPELNDKFRKHCFLFTSYLHAGFPSLPLVGGKFHYPCRERSEVSEFTLSFFEEQNQMSSKGQIIQAALGCKVQYDM